MPRPQDGSTRERRSRNGPWAVRAGGPGRARRRRTGPPPGARRGGAARTARACCHYRGHVHTGDVVAVAAARQPGPAGRAGAGGPRTITGCGADTAGRHGPPAAPWSEEYQVAHLETNHPRVDRADAVVGPPRHRCGTVDGHGGAG